MILQQLICATPTYSTLMRALMAQSLGLTISSLVGSLAAHVINIQKLDFGANLSDDHPLSAVLQFTFHCSSQVLSQPSSSPSPRTAWHKVSVCDLTNYTLMIANSLPSFPAGLLSCSDSQCSTHQSAIDFCCSALLHCISQALFTHFLLFKSVVTPFPVGMRQLVCTSPRPTFGTRFGVMLVHLALVFFFTSKRPLSAGSGMKSEGLSASNCTRGGEWLLP